VAETRVTGRNTFETTSVTIHRSQSTLVERPVPSASCPNRFWKGDLPLWGQPPADLPFESRYELGATQRPPLWVHRRISASMESISPVARYCRHALAVQIRSAFPFRSGLPRWTSKGRTDEVTTISLVRDYSVRPSSIMSEWSDGTPVNADGKPLSTGTSDHQIPEPHKPRTSTSPSKLSQSSTPRLTTNLAATVQPVWRAAMVAPMRALRDE
jgi:hypothetical protein